MLKVDVHGVRNRIYSKTYEQINKPGARMCKLKKNSYSQNYCDVNCTNNSTMTLHYNIVENAVLSTSELIILS